MDQLKKLLICTVLECLSLRNVNKILKGYLLFNGWHAINFSNINGFTKIVELL